MTGNGTASRCGFRRKGKNEPRRGWLLAETLISLSIVVLLSTAFAGWFRIVAGRIMTDVQGLRVIAETRYIHSTIQTYWRRGTVLSSPGPQRRAEFWTPEGLRHGISITYGAWLYLSDGQSQPLNTADVAEWVNGDGLTVAEGGLLRYQFGWRKGTRRWLVQSAVCPYERVYPRGRAYVFR